MQLSVATAALAVSAVAGGEAAALPLAGLLGLETAGPAGACLGLVSLAWPGTAGGYGAVGSALALAGGIGVMGLTLGIVHPSDLPVASIRGRRTVVHRPSGVTSEPRESMPS